VLSSLRLPPWRVTLPGGATLFEQGDHADAYYVLLRGRLAVFRSNEAGHEQRLVDIGVGEGVGEMALLSDEPRAATVRAVRDVELVALDAASFLDLVERVPEVGIGVMRSLVHRLRATMAATPARPRVATVTVITLDDRPGIGSVATELADVLAGVTTCCLATAGEAGSGRRLEELEARYGIVVLVPSPGDVSAVQHAASQADMVLLLADGSADTRARERALARAGELELGRWVRRELALWWAAGEPVQRAAREWGASDPTLGVTHLRNGVGRDLVRLARRVTGEEVGVVLSGGGARGFAHIGVLQALDEAEVPIGRIGGASMGAMVGALRAAELPADEQLALCRRIFVAGRPRRDHTYPEVALVRGRRLQELTRAELGEVDIEDLPVPFFSVASSLTTAEVRVDERGSLWRAVRASGSVPGYGPPMYRDGQSLVDGGVLANLPVDAMRVRVGGAVVAVDVSREDYPSLPLELDDATPSGWELRRMRRRGTDVPSLARILYRVSTLASAGAARQGREAADLSVVPPIAHVGALEFGRLDEIAELGYDAARSQLVDMAADWARLRAARPGRAAHELVDLE
jgi:NTE family protein